MQLPLYNISSLQSTGWIFPTKVCHNHVIHCSSYLIDDFLKFRIILIWFIYENIAVNLFIKKEFQSSKIPLIFCKEISYCLWVRFLTQSLLIKIRFCREILSHRVGSGKNWGERWHFDRVPKFWLPHQHKMI